MDTVPPCRLNPVRRVDGEDELRTTLLRFSDQGLGVEPGGNFGQSERIGMAEIDDDRPDARVLVEGFEDLGVVGGVTRVRLAAYPTREVDVPEAFRHGEGWPPCGARTI